MSKYHLLRDHLQSMRASSWRARFIEIEEILGFPLPKSAYHYPAWWSNQANDGHSQTAGWKAAGFRTADLDLASRKVTFERISDTRPVPAQTDEQFTLPVGPERRGLTIAEAKAGLAEYFAVPPEAIEINIRG